ncbi:unnamed protein product [Haemonchus placei]|uniref:F-box domain-containing protein n=1 Tax=Haemonchus placei TaxID=6290 RepID=A0A0N4WPC3_HAEPC|nr:unnamed protein product [Haemonchus placei]
MMGCPFSPEVLEFIVTRQRFELIRINHKKLGPFPIDDDILAKLTASEFIIDAETRITVDGIKSFLGVKISQYCEHYVSILLKDAEYVAIHGVDAVVEQRTKASMACDVALKRLPGSKNDIEPSIRNSHEEGAARYSDRTAINKNQQIATESNDCKLNAASEELTDLSLSHPTDYFPWNRLPRELQVEILRHLTRSDLDKCRVLNRETFQLIRRNEESMKRRIVEYLQIRIYYTDRDLSMLYRGQQRTRYDFEHALQDLQNAFSPWDCCSLSKLLKNATIQHLEIGNGDLTNNVLWPISSCFLNMDCRVQKLSIRDTSVVDVSSSVFLEFLRNAAPTHIEFFRISGCSCDNFSSEVLEFIVTRPKFELWSVGPEPFPIDDDILAKLTASEFIIDVTTKITVDGITSFVGGLASGKHELVRGRMRICISLGSLPFSTPSNIKAFYDGCTLTLWHIMTI